MKEYEYNFKVKDLSPYINYCKKNNYKEEIINQKRIVYENIFDNNKLARLTTNNDKVIILDYKQVNYNDGVLKKSKETKPQLITNLKETIDKLIKEGYIKTSNLIRTRYIYTKEGIKFELDDYKKPNMKVVAIEGSKTKVDKLYKEIKLLDLH